jgi:hypothetical protein
VLHTHLTGLAGPVYLVLGLVFVARVLARTFSPRVVATTVVVLAFGTNIGARICGSAVPGVRKLAGVLLGQVTTAP